MLRFCCSRLATAGIYAWLEIRVVQVLNDEPLSVAAFIYELCWCCLPDKDGCCLPLFNKNIGVSGLWWGVLVFKWNKERDLEICAARFYQACHGHSHVNLHF